MSADRFSNSPLVIKARHISSVPTGPAMHRLVVYEPQDYSIKQGVQYPNVELHDVAGVHTKQTRVSVWSVQRFSYQEDDKELVVHHIDLCDVGHLIQCKGS